MRFVGYAGRVESVTGLNSSQKKKKQKNIEEEEEELMKKHYKRKRTKFMTKLQLTIHINNRES